MGIQNTSLFFLPYKHGRERTEYWKTTVYQFSLTLIFLKVKGMKDSVVSREHTGYVENFGRSYSPLAGRNITQLACLDAHNVDGNKICLTTN